jgi:hypothetical protein
MFADRVEKKLVRATVYTTSHMKLEGCLFVPKAVRLIDELNTRHQDFIAVAEAVLASEESPADSTQGLILLNKHQIVCVVLHGDDTVLDES